MFTFFVARIKNAEIEEFPGGQWLGLSALTAMGPGSIPGQETTISHAAWCEEQQQKSPEIIHRIFASATCFFTPHCSSDLRMSAHRIIHFN